MKFDSHPEATPRGLFDIHKGPLKACRKPDSQERLASILSKGQSAPKPEVAEPDSKHLQEELEMYSE